MRGVRLGAAIGGGLACSLAFAIGCSQSGGKSGGTGSTVAGSTTPPTSGGKIEYVELQVEEPLRAGDIVDVLGRTVAASVPVKGLALRPGMYLTATPSG